MAWRKQQPPGAATAPPDLSVLRWIATLAVQLGRSVADTDAALLVLGLGLAPAVRLVMSIMVMGLVFVMKGDHFSVAWDKGSASWYRYGLV